MPTNAEVNSYLDWLIENFIESSYVLTPRGVDQGPPWVQEFAFAATDYIYREGSLDFAQPMEQPRSGERFLLSGRNLGLRDFELHFNCRAEGGQIDFRGANSDKDLAVVMRCPTNAGGVPIAVVKENVIQIERKETQEFVRVKVAAIDQDSGKALKNHNRTLAFMLDI
jgi:hypothetical protein